MLFLAPFLDASAVGAASSPHYVTTTYVFQTATNSSQWFVAESVSKPVTVQVNGAVIPEYYSLTLLNQTVIGEQCLSGSGAGCTRRVWKSEQGWYWDGSADLLYVHYMGSYPTTRVAVTSLPGSASTTSSGSSGSSSNGTSSAIPSPILDETPYLLASIVAGGLVVMVILVLRYRVRVRRYARALRRRAVRYLRTLKRKLRILWVPD